MKRSVSAMMFAVCAAGLVCASSTPLWAQSDDAAATTEYPLAVFHAASIDRIEQRSQTVFTAAGRDDILGKLQEWLSKSASSLNGMDRTRPFGMMVYLKPGFGGLSGVGYLPVEDLDAFLDTLSLGTGNVRPVSGEPNRYSIANDFFPMAALHRDGYLFITAEDESAELDRKFPAPAKLVSRLNSRYDVAVSLMIKSIPPATRQLFVTFLQTQTMAELQQKDDEPEAAYRVRKANGESTMEFIEKIVLQGEELTLGGRIDDALGVGEIDLEVAGTPDSKLAKFFQGMVGRKSLFANIVKQPAMMTMAMSWQLDEQQRKAFVELFTLAPEEIDRRATAEGIEGTQSAWEPIFATLLQAAEAGHLDGFVQIAGEGEQGYAVLAGVRVGGGASLPRQLADALAFAKEKFGGNDRIASLELNVDQIDGQPVHALPAAPPDRAGRWMYGDGAKLYVYATTQALWFAFGGDSALENLKAGVAAAKKPAAPGDRQPRIPFVFETRANGWVTAQKKAESLVPTELEQQRNDEAQVRMETALAEAQRRQAEAEQRNPQQRRGNAGNRRRAPSPDEIRRRSERFNTEVRAAFDDQNDGLRIEVRPTDSGARLQFQFQKGWVALFGRLLALRIDRAYEPPVIPAPTGQSDPTEPAPSDGD